MLKLINTIDICLDACSHDVGISAEAVVEVSVMLNLYVYLTTVIATLAYSLNSHFLENHLTVNDLLKSLD